ncbi:hypothetical protein Hdeb2414_s0003g00099361 [Helianthus debilis subsp. tardiflorus]
MNVQNKKPPFEEFVRMRKVMRCPLFKPLLLHWKQNSSWLEWRNNEGSFSL